MEELFTKEKKKIECPYCEGDGMIKRPARKQKDMEMKKHIAKNLKDDGYSIREIMRIMNYKSPRSVQTLLD